MFKTTLYTNQDFSFIWKPHAIPSTFGKEESFLDILKNQTHRQTLFGVPFADIRDVSQDSPLPITYIQGEQELDIQTRFSQQIQVFSQQEEFGLLNRLDNDTGGFLYFARNKVSYTQYKKLQKEGKIKKHYLAQVEGKLEDITIDTTIMHHKSIPEKMLVIQNPQDIRLGRGKQHQVETKIELLHYNPQTNVSSLSITIQRGVRHQIRAHLASKGCPIIGDLLYGKKGTYLHLRSIGFSF